MIKIIQVFIIATLFFINANAQLDSVQLLEVVLIATKDVKNTFHIPNALFKIDSKQLALHQVRTSPEALLSEGCWVQKTNHGGGSVFMRGLTGNQVLLLIDGVRLNNSTYRYGPNQYLNTIDVFSLSSIEMMQGSGSILYGSDALGGTLQLRTTNLDFSDKQKIESSVLGRLASHGMERSTHADIKISNKKWVIGGGVTIRKFGDLLGGDTTGLQSPSAYNEFAFDLKSKIAITKNITLTALHQMVRQENVAVFHKVKLENFKLNQMNPQQRSLSYLKLNYKPNLNFLDRLEATVSLQNTFETRMSQKNTSSIQTDETDKIDVLGANVFGETIVNNHYKINTGIECYLDKVSSNKIEWDRIADSKIEKRGLYPNGASYTNFAAYQNHYYTQGKALFQFGMRWNNYKITLKDKDLGMIKINPSAFVYNASAQYFLHEKQQLYLHFNTGFRAPNIDDMGTLGIVDFRYELPNYELKPEYSRNLELGYKFKSKHFKLNTYLYYNHLENLITRTKQNQSINNYQVYIKENSDKAYIKGIEANASVSLTSYLNVKGAINYTYGQNISKHEPLRRIPPLYYNMQVDVLIDNFYTNLTYLGAAHQDRLAQGDKDDNRIPKGGTPAFDLFHWYIGYTWKTIEANVSVQNIFNTDYRIHGSGINGAGRHFVFSLKFNFIK